MREFRNSFGDADEDWRENPEYWKYERINYLPDNKSTWFEGWNKHKHAVAQLVAKANDWTVCHKFLDICCEVMFRLEKNGAFNHFKLSDDFCVSVCDNDDSEYAAEKLAELKSRQ